MQIGTEGQFIVGFSVHGRAGDTACLIPHLEGVRKGLKRLPKKIVAVAAYGRTTAVGSIQRLVIPNLLRRLYIR